MNFALATSPPRNKGQASSRWLAENLGAAWLRILDVRRAAPTLDDRGILRLGAEDDDPPRFVELGPRAGWLRAGSWPKAPHPPDSFLRGHIPGSASLDVAYRLFDDTGTLVCAPELAMAMSELGVGDEHTVVLVDDGPAGAALVAAWALRHYGHADTLVLAGGFPRWVAEQRPVTRELVRHPFASFTARSPS